VAVEVVVAAAVEVADPPPPEAVEDKRISKYRDHVH
jgi:hypothetical protein